VPQGHELGGVGLDVGLDAGDVGEGRVAVALGAVDRLPRSDLPLEELAGPRDLGLGEPHVGLGFGDARNLTSEAMAALEAADAVYGYGPYLARVPARPGQSRHASDNREELARAGAALDHAASGTSVAMVSGGDPGVFAMAAAVMEAIDHGPAEWRARAADRRLLPQVRRHRRARLGAPLGADFCVISLSDNLKPWDVVARRLRGAAELDFVVALYNPASKARPRQIYDAFDLLRGVKDPATVVVFARAIGRPDERVVITTLADADPGLVDMATCVIIGNSATRRIDRPDGRDSLVYSPRSVARD